MDWSLNKEIALAIKTIYRTGLGNKTSKYTDFLKLLQNGQITSESNKLATRWMR